MALTPIKHINLASVLVAVSLLLTPGLASADISKSVSLGVNIGCVGTVNTQPGTTSTTVAYGSTVSLPVSNDGSAVVSQSVSGPGIPNGTVLQPDNKGSTYSSDTFSIGPVTSPITLTFTPIPSNDSGQIYDNNCPTGSTPQASYVVFNPAIPPSPTPPPASSGASKTTTSPPLTPSPSPNQTSAATDTKPTLTSLPDGVKPIAAPAPVTPSTKNTSNIVWEFLVLVVLVPLVWLAWQKKLIGSSGKGKSNNMTKKKK